MKTRVGTPVGQRVTVYVDRFKMIFLMSVFLHLSFVVGFDVMMHNNMPERVTGMLERHGIITSMSDDHQGLTPGAENEWYGTIRQKKSGEDVHPRRRLLRSVN